MRGIIVASALVGALVSGCGGAQSKALSADAAMRANTGDAVGTTWITSAELNSLSASVLAQPEPPPAASEEGPQPVPTWGTAEPAIAAGASGAPQDPATPGRAADPSEPPSSR
jgi:hypothetical protein